MSPPSTRSASTAVLSPIDLEDVGDPPGDRLERRARDVRRARPACQPGDHRPRVGSPPRRSEPGERRQHPHAAGVLDLAGEGRKRGRVRREPEVARKPLEQRAGGEHATVEAHSTSPLTRQATSEGARPFPRAAPCRHWRARTRPCRMWPWFARLDAAGARERGLLVRAPRAQRQLPGQDGWRSTPRSPAVSAMSGAPRAARRRSRAARRPSRAPPSCVRDAVEGSVRTRRRGDRTGTSPPCPCAVSPPRARPHPVVVLEQPGELPGREVRVERQAARFRIVCRARRLEPVEHLLGALVLPRHHRRQRLVRSRRPTPARLALMVEPAGDDLPGRV